MKSIKVTDLGAIKNELRKYKAGKKFDINQFNQVARLAWLGRIVLQPLDPEDPDCRAMLVYVQEPEGLAAHVLRLDQDLVGHMHIVDGEQAQALVRILEEGVRARARQLQELDQRDFYFPHFYRPEEEEGESK